MRIDDPLVRVVALAEKVLVSDAELEALEHGPGEPVTPSRAERERLQALELNWRQREKHAAAAREVLAALFEATQRPGNLPPVQSPHSAAIRSRAERQADVNNRLRQEVRAAIRVCVPAKFDAIARAAQALGPLLAQNFERGGRMESKEGFRYWPKAVDESSLAILGLDAVAAAAGRLDGLRMTATWAELEQVAVHPARLDVPSGTPGRARAAAVAVAAAGAVVAAAALGI